MSKVIVAIGYSSYLAKEPPPAAALKWLMGLVDVRMDYDKSRQAGFKSQWLVGEPIKLEVQHVGDKQLSVKREEEELSKETQGMLSRIAARKEQLMLDAPKDAI